MSKCPCGSGSDLSNCCEPIIMNFTATTAEKLMRSRYTAYSLGNAEYIFQTTHPSVRNQLDLRDIKEWSTSNQWSKLEIMSTQKGLESDIEGVVEFKAHYTDTLSKPHIHHEISSFSKKDGQWFYVIGSFPEPLPAPALKTSRNSPCPCGSGKKFKKCCG
ncbi:YchJ family protein [Echinicola sp. CAU 1574]|uniref:YchJ family protein n=1 Tax=Echinicola arenosa TaxID=2774144 RepID=A0ABR9AQ65_9BACT|nr:YchJ family protein [Echinicola arenosa]MBD8490912.1 YchJ family protein [Echinicola arenosa]